MSALVLLYLWLWLLDQLKELHRAQGYSNVGLQILARILWVVAEFKGEGAGVAQRILIDDNTTIRVG
jgi:hypothetical protein